MMTKRIKWTGLLSLLAVTILLISGCQQPLSNQDLSADPFTLPWSFDEEGRIISISGNSGGHTAGGNSDFQLSMDNTSGNALWHGVYCILLIDEEGVIKEVAHEQYSVPVGLKTQKTVTVEFPEDLEGPLGLCIVLPQHSSMATTLWVGSNRSEGAGPWPNIETCPCCLTEEVSRQLAETFVRNSPTFKYDGDMASLELVETLYPDIENAWQFCFRFESAHAGYGDRDGQMLAQVITPHEVIVTVEKGVVKNAIMDGEWDMVNQCMLDGIEISLAPIHEVDVQFMESDPVQVGVQIKGGLRDGCTTFHNATVTRDGNNVNIEVTTQRPRDAMCNQVYTFFEEYLNIGSDFESGVTYTINVNDYTTTFVMQ
ncbi:MAG: hypothetical protein WCX07_05340 [Dehalococcoidales bacterium]|jgi:hypothetical protein